MTKKKKKTRKFKKSPKLFTKEFKEELFLLWAEGKSLNEIQKKYANTEKQFSFPRLSQIKIAEKWDKRKQEIEDKIAKKTDKEIVRVNAKKIRIINELIDKVFDFIKRDIDRYADNPEQVVELARKENKPLPFWYLQNIDDLVFFLKLHNEVVNEKASTPENLNLNQFNFVNNNKQLPQSTQSKLLEVLSQEKQKLIECEKK